MLNNCNTAAGMRVTAIAEKAHFEFEFQAELEVLGGCKQKNTRAAAGNRRQPRTSQLQVTS